MSSAPNAPSLTTIEEMCASVQRICSRTGRAVASFSSSLAMAKADLYDGVEDFTDSMCDFYMKQVELLEQERKETLRRGGVHPPCTHALFEKSFAIAMSILSDDSSELGAGSSATLSESHVDDIDENDCVDSHTRAVNCRYSYLYTEMARRKIRAHRGLTELLRNVTNQTRELVQQLTYVSRLALDTRTKAEQYASNPLSDTQIEPFHRDAGKAIKKFMRVFERKTVRFALTINAADRTKLDVKMEMLDATTPAPATTRLEFFDAETDADVKRMLAPVTVPATNN